VGVCGWEPPHLRSWRRSVAGANAGCAPIPDAVARNLTTARAISLLARCRFTVRLTAPLSAFYSNFGNVPPQNVSLTFTGASSIVPSGRCPVATAAAAAGAATVTAATADLRRRHINGRPRPPMRRSASCLLSRAYRHRVALASPSLLRLLLPRSRLRARRVHAVPAGHHVLLLHHLAHHVRFWRRGGAASRRRVPAATRCLSLPCPCARASETLCACPSVLDRCRAHSLWSLALPAHVRRFAVYTWGLFAAKGAKNPATGKQV
jgi:hypothetical protein